MLNNIKQQLSELEVSEESNADKRRSLDEIKELFQSHLIEIVKPRTQDYFFRYFLYTFDI